MPDLETLLRDVKPAPDPAWTLKLDTRVAHRFPKPLTRSQRVLRALRAHWMATTAGLLVMSAVAFVVVVVGTTYTDTSSENFASAPAAMPESDSSGGSSAITPDAAAPLQRQARAVKTNAALTLATTPDKVPALADRVMATVDSLGGFVQSSQVDQQSSRSAGATLALRIPSAKLEDGLARISKLAHVKARSQETEDLTDTREAMQARVRDARADRAGLRTRLAKATTDAERSRLRAALDRATRRVTQAQRQVNELNHEVSYATVDLTIEGERRSGAAVAPGDRWTPGDALGDAVRVLEVVAGVAVIALAVILPIALIAVLAGFAARILTRRRRERALEVA